MSYSADDVRSVDVIEGGRRSVCQRVTPVEHGFVELLAVVGRWVLPGQSLQRCS